jgi:adenosylhomocysteine nucleosidase
MLTGMARTLLVVPEWDELAPILGRFEQLVGALRPLQVGRLACFEAPSLGLVAALGGHGKVQFGVQSQYLIDRLGPLDVLVCAGAAGRLSEALQLGDVVVGTATVEHDYALRFVPAPVPEHPATPALLSPLRAVAGSGELGFGIEFGPIASGDEDVVERARALELRAATGALCVAWEGSGGARAAAFNGLGFVELRCITDGADAGAAASFVEQCARVLPHLADLLAHWLVPGDRLRLRMPG